MEIPKRIPTLENFTKSEVNESATDEKSVVKELIETGQEIDWIDKNLMGGEAQTSRGFIEDDEGALVDKLLAQTGKNAELFQQIVDDIQYDGILYYDFDSEELKKLKKEYRLENHKKNFDS